MVNEEPSAPPGPEAEAKRILEHNARMFANVAKHATPGESHELVRRLEGFWRVEASSRDADSPWAAGFKGTAEGRLIFGGRYLELKVRLAGPTGPSEATSILGFDIITQRPVAATWTSDGHGIRYAESAWDVANQTMWESGMMPIPGTPRKIPYTCSMRFVEPGHVRQRYRLALEQGRMRDTLQVDLYRLPKAPEGEAPQPPAPRCPPPAEAERAREILGRLTGVWRADQTMVFGVGGERIALEGKCESRAIQGGAQVESQMRLSHDIIALDTRAVHSYDPIDDRFNMIRLEQHATGIMHAEGTWDEASQTLWEHGEISNAMVGLRHPFSCATHFHGTERIEREFWFPGPDGRFVPYKQTFLSRLPE